MEKEYNDMTKQISKYPSTFYRVSLKAIIRNQQGQVLALKATDDAFSQMWDLPGGGMEHGQNERQTFAKEFYEEALIEAPILHYKMLGLEPCYTPNKQAWWLGIFYEVVLPNGFLYGVGRDASEVAFISPHSLKYSPHITEQLIYKWATKKTGQ